MREIFRIHKTTLIERVLLFGTITSIPLQDHIGAMGGISASFLMFALLGSYLILCRGNELLKISHNSIFLAGYAFIGVGFFMELVNNSFGFREIIQIGFMVLGGVGIASVCRDEKALKIGLYGYLFAGVVTAAVFIFSTYGSLSLASGNSFTDASAIRAEVRGNNPLEGNSNKLAFIIAQGAVAGLAMAFTEKLSYRRAILFTLCAICIIGTFLPMSRSAILILFASSAVVIFFRGLMNFRVIMAKLTLEQTNEHADQDLASAPALQAQEVF